MSTSAPSTTVPAPQEIDALLRLLDDDTPVVRDHVSARLAQCGGDLSAWFAHHARSLTPLEHDLLAAILRPARRETLLRLWALPTDDSPALAENWDHLEYLLGLLSDYLHDGITPRPPLTAALGQLAAEASAAGIADEMTLRKFLFQQKKLSGNQNTYLDPRNSDLAWSLAEGHSNPLGLCLIYMLVARRMGLRVEGVNFPGHFLCRIYQEDYPIIIDCFDGGQIHLQATLMEKESDLTRQQRAQLAQSADPATIIVRVLNNLVSAYQQSGDNAEVALIESLRATLGH